MLERLKKCRKAYTPKCIAVESRSSAEKFEEKENVRNLGESEYSKNNEYNQSNN